MDSEADRERAVNGSVWLVRNCFIRTAENEPFQTQLAKGWVGLDVWDGHGWIGRAGWGEVEKGEDKSEKIQF